MASVGFATGLDIVALARFERLLARTPEFTERFFTAAERERCEQNLRRARAFATAFAVQEALLKALGVGILGPIALREIEVHDAAGRAHVRLSGPAAHAVGTRRAWVSTACDGVHAWALVVLS